MSVGTKHGTDKFAAHDVALAEWARAIAHPARLRILAVLAAQDRCVCGDIVDELPLAQSTVSQHLGELKRVGLVKGTIDGPRICYCLDHKALQRFRAAVSLFLDDLQKQTPPDCC